MAALLVILSVCFLHTVQGKDTASFDVDPTNSTKDMYVVQATVYQVGIISNKSDEEIANMTGDQEALTFYRSNGSAVDLSAIPAPLMTNVTAQSVVGLAPVAAGAGPWPALRGPAPAPTPAGQSANFFRSLNEDNVGRQKRADGPPSPSTKVVKETAVLPPAAGLRALGLPELLGLNASLASLPVPVPNTSIVHYTKMNTLVQTP